MHQSPSPEKQNAAAAGGTHDAPESQGMSMAPPAFQLKAAGAEAPPPAQLKGNSGGLPGDMVQGFAASTGHDLSDVKVHQNSDKPSQVGALAYAQGNDIHLGAGQEKHLAHEAAHIVQQREGRVQANTSVAGMPVNDDKGLESEADNMGAKAMQMKSAGLQAQNAAAGATSAGPSAIQRYAVPIEGKAPASAITITEFIKLVEAEEAKYPLAEQRNIKLMISRLRKIFYNSSGWDDHLIKGAKDVKAPYEKKERERSRRSVEVLGPNFDMVDKEVYPVDASGNKPDIYKNQEVKLETGGTAGMYCDIGHVFAGLDAINHPATVDGPGTINIDNVAGTTWTGDLGSVLAEVQIDYVNGGDAAVDWQKRVDEYAPAQDMLGNIDAYVMGYHYAIHDTKANWKVSDMLREYYLGAASVSPQSTRYTSFSKHIGLAGWDGSKWNNEAAMVSAWEDEVNDAAALYIGAGADWGLFSLPAAGGAVLGMAGNGGSKHLLERFFDALRSRRATEPK